MIQLFSMEAVTFAASFTIIMYMFYRKGKKDGIREGIEITAEYIEALGLLSSESDPDE